MEGFMGFKSLQLPEGDLLRWPVYGFLMLLPMGAVVIKHAGSGSLVLLSLLGISTFFLKGYRSPAPVEKRLFITVGFFFIVALLSYVLGEMNYRGFKDLGSFLRLLLLIPFIYLLLRVRVTQGVFWWGLALGAIVAGVHAIYEVSSGWPSMNKALRAGGVTNPIYFGNLSLVMGGMAFAGLKYFRNRGIALAALPFVALVFGLIASFLSGSRGGWVALPALFMLYLWFYWRSLRAWQRWGTMVLVPLVFLLVYLLPQTGVQERVQAAVADIEAYYDEEDRYVDSALGLRFEMWKVSWTAFSRSPLLGVGVGGYDKVWHELREERQLHASTAGEPHNEYLLVLATRGLIGFVALMLMFVLPGVVFFRGARAGSPEQAAFGLAGLVLVVAYMHFGLSAAVFYRKLTISFYAFYIALITHLLVNDALFNQGRNEAGSSRTVVKI
jgi:O-antigen ligase